jgi:hypothetical protein
MIMTIMERLDKQPMQYRILISILLTIVVVFLDHWAGFSYRMKLFYLMPISFATWFIGSEAGMVLSTLPVITMLYSGIASGNSEGTVSMQMWDMMMYVVFFIILTMLLAKLRITMQQRAGLIAKLQSALDAVKDLSGILPICANCKKIRDDEGYWHDVEVYISNHTNADFTHGICAECVSKLYPSLFDKIGS